MNLFWGGACQVEGSPVTLGFLTALGDPSEHMSLSGWTYLACPPPTAEGIRTAGVQGTHGSDLEQPLPQVITAGGLRMTQERGGGGL